MRLKWILIVPETTETGTSICSGLKIAEARARTWARSVQARWMPGFGPIWVDCRHLLSLWDKCHYPICVGFFRSPFFSTRVILPFEFETLPCFRGLQIGTVVFKGNSDSFFKLMTKIIIRPLHVKHYKDYKHGTSCWRTVGNSMLWLLKVS